MAPPAPFSARRRLRRALAPIAATLLLIAVAAPASASTDTFRRALQNILFAPLDFALSPVVAGWTINRNIRDIDDSPGVRVAYLIPGYVWTTGVQIGAATVREVTGLIELLPGLGLLFVEADLDPLFAPAERGDAIVDLDADIMYVRFGINYTTQSF